jgi:hypothetical protein
MEALGIFMYFGSFFNVDAIEEKVEMVKKMAQIFFKNKKQLFFYFLKLV